MEIATLPTVARNDRGDVSQEFSNIDELNKEIEEKQAQLSKMTDINLAAIDQLKELEERSSNLDMQASDLIKSKESMQGLIRRLNHDSRDKFEATFKQIQENFNQIFRKVFGGGKAYMELVYAAEPEPEPTAEGDGVQSVVSSESTATPDASAVAPAPATPESGRLDPLEAGIEIMAKPPGKEVSSITLLSGGEKVMTAFALTMAIFKLQPSPFCVLDEVDAALDDSNVEQFVALVREYITETQFVMITHNKKSMMAGDRLYGLTMQKPGVSKKISVQFANELEPLLTQELASVPV